MAEKNDVEGEQIEMMEKFCYAGSRNTRIENSEVI
jgi:hypothetical protein